MTADEQAEVSKLAQSARGRRRQHLPTDPKVISSNKLTILLIELYEQGVAISEMAKHAKVTYHSIYARLEEHLRSKNA